MQPHTREALMGLLGQYEKKYGKLPTRRELRSEFGVSDNPYVRVFGSWGAAKTAYESATAATSAPPGSSYNPTSLLEELGRNVGEQELKAIVSATRQQRASILPLLTAISPEPESSSFKALVMGDTHIGHSKFHEAWWYGMLKRAEQEGCDWGWHVGDMLEGMSGRPGHVYELAAIGFEKQFELARRLIGDSPFPIRGITGNHDLWYAGKGDMGINVGHRLADALPGKFIFLGDEEADETFGSTRIKLWHGRDGASYAISYRCQKFVEGLTESEKPHILLSGHAHKSVFFECRNVQVLEVGTLCSQTGFMRGKKLAAHCGYWIIEVHTNAHGLLRIKPEWHPLQ